PRAGSCPRTARTSSPAPARPRSAGRKHPLPAPDRPRPRLPDPGPPSLLVKGQNRAMITRRSGYLSLSADPAPAATEQLQREGYVVLPGVLSPAETKALGEDIERVFEEYPPDERVPGLAAEHWVPFRYEMLNRSEACQRAVAHPSILQVIEPLLGEDCHLASGEQGAGPAVAAARYVALFVSDVRHRRLASGPHGPGRFFLQCHYGRRDLTQRLRPTSAANHLSPEAVARAQTKRERTL